MSPAQAGEDRPDAFTAIPEFTVTWLPDGTWRGRYHVDPALVIDRNTWPELEAACRDARLKRSRPRAAEQTTEAGT